MFSGSSSGARPDYVTAARRLGTVLANRGLRVVYGGGGGGLMGAMADAALNAGGHVVGVIPRALVRAELAHRGLTRLVEVHSMHERKARMAAEADAFIALPGGYGTLDELFEALSWTQLGLQDKAVGLLNVNGFFDGLTGFLDHLLAERFIQAAHRALLQVAPTPETLLALLERYQPTRVPKVVDRPRRSRVEDETG